MRIWKPRIVLGQVAQAIIKSLEVNAEKWRSDEFRLWIGAVSQRDAAVMIWIANKDYGLKLEGASAPLLTDAEKLAIWRSFVNWNTKTEAGRFLELLAQAEAV